MPFKVPLTWVRRARVIEKGGASVVVNNPNDLAEIKALIEARDFCEFLVTEREYEEEQWSFAPILTEQDNDNPDTPSEPDYA